ncbi:MAG TPA: ABC transporter permease subunit, partial [Roseiarcus sp.]|nr:ABC transporter permease subunit [Roseiarcus sp.]
MSFEILWRYAPALVGGFGVTVLCWSLGAVIGLTFGLAIALLGRLELAPLRWLLRACVETIRGTPFLVQLFLLYAGGPFIGLKLSATAAGILGLGAYSSAYFSEIFRAGFASVPEGQSEAAISVGMRPVDIFWRIRLPIAL